MISYSLEYDAGTGEDTWETLIGYLSHNTGLSMVVTDKIDRGVMYKFRLRAKNIWGWGVYSQETSILAARVPLKPTDLVASIVESTGAFRLDWEIADDQGSELLATEVDLYSVSLDSWVLSATLNADKASYEIPMSELEEVYGYSQGEIIEVRVRSSN